MSINVDRKKIVIIAILLVVGGFIWWFVSTKDERARKVQYKQLVNFANRQVVEIAVIKQAAELQQLKVAMQKAQIKEPPISAIPPKIEGSLKK